MDEKVVIRNFTGHCLNLVNSIKFPAECIVTLPQEGKCYSAEEHDPIEDRMSTLSMVYGYTNLYTDGYHIPKLPDPVPNNIFVVSDRKTAIHCALLGREDVDTDLMNDHDGAILGNDAIHMINLIDD